MIDLTERIIIDYNTDWLEDCQIHFLAYSYEIDGKFVMVEYSGFYASLKQINEFKTDGTFIEKIKAYEKEFGSEQKQYCEECEYMKIAYYYDHYNNGKEPIFTTNLTEDSPAGMYLI